VFSGLLGLKFEDPVLRLVLHPLTLEFILGAALGLLVQRGLYPSPRLLLTLGLACWIGFYAIHRALGGSAAPSDGWVRLALFGLPCCLVLYGAVGLEARDRKTAPEWLCAIGDWSYSLYLSHFLVLSARERPCCSWVYLQRLTPSFRFLQTASVSEPGSCLGVD
jgi:peptidoglycan/LPS O-acetylase OafA/YrhL